MSNKTDEAFDDLCGHLDDWMNDNPVIFNMLNHSWLFSDNAARVIYENILEIDPPVRED